MAVGDLVTVTKPDGLDPPGFYKVLCRVVNDAGALAELISLSDSAVAALLAALGGGGGAGTAATTSVDDADLTNLTAAFGGPVDNVQDALQATDDGFTLIAAQFADKVTADDVRAVVSTTFISPGVSGAETIPDDTDFAVYVLEGHTTFTMPASPGRIEIRIYQDATGGWVPTFVDSVASPVLFPGGTPTFSTAVGATDIVYASKPNGGGGWVATAALDFSV